MNFDTPDDIRQRAAANRAAPTAPTQPTQPTQPSQQTAPGWSADKAVQAPAAGPSMAGRSVNLLARGAGAAQAGMAGMNMVEKGVTPDAVSQMAGGAAQTLLPPQLGIPFNAALAVGGGVPSFFKNRADNVPYSLGVDPRGPATKEFVKATGYQDAEQAKIAAAGTAAAPAPVAAPAPAGGVVEGGTIPSTFPMPAVMTQPISRGAPVTAPAQPIAGPMPPTVVSSVGADGNVTTTNGPGRGSSGYYAPQPAPLGARAPMQTPLGPLPKLQAEQGQSIFSALSNLGMDMSKYRDTATANKQASTDFNNQLRAGQFNISAIKDKSQLQLAFNEDERKGLDSEIKTRSAEALRVLASGQFPKEHEQGLRLLSGLEKGKYQPAIIYGAPDENGVQQKMTVALRDDGSVVPLRVPGFNESGGAAGNTVPRAAVETAARQKGLTYDQMRKVVEQQGKKVSG